MDWSILDQRPVIVAVAGPNGAGKSTFYDVHLADVGLQFVNADRIAREVGIDAYEAADTANRIRRELFENWQSFVFETVFSDPVGEKLAFLRKAAIAGYTVVLCFVGVSSPDVSEARIAVRVSQGGHDVPSDKLRSRFARTMANLHAAIQELPLVAIFDNSDPKSPFRELATFCDGALISSAEPLPTWFERILLP